MGVELDEKLTQNNGKFGSQIYFNCPMGHGLMVPMDKVRVFKPARPVLPPAADTRSINSFESDSIENERSRKMDRAMSIKRSKSVADLSRQVKTINWMQSPDVKRKVSTGFMSLSRSKSISNLHERRRDHSFQDPRSVLDQVKKMQPTMDGPQYGEYPNQFQTIDYGAPYGAASSVHDYGESRSHHGDQGALHQSFSRILNVRGQQPQYSAEPLPTPFSYARSRHAESSFSDMRSEISFSSASDM